MVNYSLCQAQNSVLAADPNLSFARDDTGWYLLDQATGNVYRSLMDDGEPADYAYLGRLGRASGGDR